MSKRGMMALALVAGMATGANAQEEKIVVKPSGRILLDGAMMHSNNEELNQQAEGGFTMPDIRVGLKASYGPWKAKVDVGYGRSTLSMKDVFLEYDFHGGNLLRGGYFCHQFSYQSATSSSFKVAMEAPETSAFSNGERLLGVMFEHYDDKFLAAASVYSDNQSFKKATNETGYQGKGMMGRFVYHPTVKRGNLFQVGMGVSYEEASKNRKNMKWSANYPTRVCELTAIGAELQDAKGDIKVTGELVRAKGRVGLEAQYNYMNVWRDGAPNYATWGAYGNLRFLLNGEYAYNIQDGGIDTPDPKSWEIVASYNYTDMNDGDIRGGKLSDWALSMNYYINKYMVWRVSAHYANVGSNNTGITAIAEKNKYSVLETRLQFKL